MRTPFYVLIAGAVALSAAGMNPSSGTAARTLAAHSAGSAVQPANANTTVSNPVAARSAVVELRREQVASALETLEAAVVRESHDGALRSAFQAYFNYRAAHPDDVNNPYLYYVDYGLDNRTPRGYVFNMDDLTVVDGPFIVAHGRGSSSGKDGAPTRFSNAKGSASTSLGLFVTQGTYGFSGHAAGHLYSSIGLRLEGVSGRFNDAARARKVVVHGAPYVTPKGAGRSEGCPAMELARAQRLIPLIANGGLVFLYSPADQTWVSQDPWATAAS